MQSELQLARYIGGEAFFARNICPWVSDITLLASKLQLIIANQDFGWTNAAIMGGSME